MPKMRHMNAQAVRLRRRRNSMAAGAVRESRDILSQSGPERVYRTDVQFTGTEAHGGRMPQKGTPERVDIEARMCLLYAKGLSHTQISCELDINQSRISAVLKRHNIRKGSSK